MPTPTTTTTDSISLLQATHTMGRLNHSETHDLIILIIYSLHEQLFLHSDDERDQATLIVIRRCHADEQQTQKIAENSYRQTQDVIRQEILHEQEPILLSTPSDAKL